jgi:hypothetical protein
VLTVKAALVAAVVGAVLAGGCSPARPASAEWAPAWQAAQDGIPPIETLTEGDAEMACERTLASIRALRGGIVPTHDPTLDGLVRGWLQVAETTFFECPPRSGVVVGFEEAYAELERYRLEMEAGIGS